MLKKVTVVEDDDVDATMTERRVLALSSGCPFLTRLHATFQTNAHLYFVLEFINGGDLFFHVDKNGKFPEPTVAFYTAEICIGLWFLHDKGVIYRDLKLDNVMLAGDGHVKIADFGLCKENMWGAATTTTFCGTPAYIAPEIIKEQPYGNNVDWWSLGVLVYEMATGNTPFEGEDEDEMFEKIQNHTVEFPEHMSPQLINLVTSFLNRSPEERLGNGEAGKDAIKSHPVSWGGGGSGLRGVVQRARN
jgi:classical protein kinase C beta type